MEKKTPCCRGENDPYVPVDGLTCVRPLPKFVDAIRFIFFSKVEENVVHRVHGHGLMVFVRRQFFGCGELAFWHVV